MEHLSETLRAAAADPPPSGIDLDRLIAGERRARQRRWLIGPAVAVAVLAIAGTVTLTFRSPGSHGAGGPPSSSGPTAEPVGRCTAVRPSPTGESTVDPGKATTTAPVPPTALTEPEGAAIARLSGVLNARLATVLPNASFADVIHPNCAGIQFAGDIYPGRYYASLQVKEGERLATLVVMIHYRPFVDMNVYQNSRSLPDGTEVGWNDESRVGNVKGGRDIQASVLRPDGTFLTLLSHNDLMMATGPSVPSPVTAEQVVALGTDPGLTLYP